MEDVPFALSGLPLFGLVKEGGQAGGGNILKLISRVEAKNLCYQPCIKPVITLSQVSSWF